MDILNFERIKFIYKRSKLVFESLTHKIYRHLCLLYMFTTYLIFVYVF